MLPISHQFDAYELESKGYRDIFKIELQDTSSTALYLTPHNELIYLDHTWESIPCKLSENAQNSTGEHSRPKFSIVNPGGVFSLWVGQGVVEGAILTRYRILLSDLEANVRNYSRNLWVISKIVSLDQDMLVVELRSTYDGNNYKLPSRFFYPPDFPHVSLQ